MSANGNLITGACLDLWEATGRGKLLVAVSGGADSIALLLACRMAGIPVEAAHCNYNLRGEESLRDRDFVVDFCRKKDIPLHLREFDVEKKALPGESLEMTCRRLRYDFFKSLMEELGIGRVAVAHNADDNRETLLLNLLRGSGSAGLKGMSAVSESVIRPLLKFNRTEILEFLKEQGQGYVTDSSNLTSAYRRNFLRNEILPSLKSRWPGALSAIDKTIDIMGRENRILSYYIGSELGENPMELPLKSIKSFPDPQTLILHFIREHGGTPEIAREIAGSSFAPGKKWKLGAEREVVMAREALKIEFTKGAEGMGENPEDEYIWEEVENVEEALRQVVRLGNSAALLPFGPEAYEWVRADRTMTLAPLGMTGKQKVWKVLKDFGTTLHERNNFYLLADRATGDIIWIPGIKRSKLHLVEGSSQSAYLVKRR